MQWDEAIKWLSGKRYLQALLERGARGVPLGTKGRKKRKKQAVVPHRA